VDLSKQNSPGVRLVVWAEFFSQGTQLLVDRMNFFRYIVSILKQAMQMVRSGHGSSVASSRQKKVQEEQNRVHRRAREQEALIDKEERNLEEQEAADSANNAIYAKANAKARLSDISGMAASGRARLRPPPGFSENLCLNHATCMHRGRGEAGFPSCADASDANCSMCPNVTANISMNGDISSGCCRDRSDNLKCWTS
jgi:hypothetical protein